jgi:hypothetical protein
MDALPTRSILVKQVFPVAVGLGAGIAVTLYFGASLRYSFQLGAAAVIGVAVAMGLWRLVVGK